TAATTVSVSPCLPIWTTGSSAWPRARRWRRCLPVSGRGAGFSGSVIGSFQASDGERLAVLAPDSAEHVADLPHGGPGLHGGEGGGQEVVRALGGGVDGGQGGGLPGPVVLRPPGAGALHLLALDAGVDLHRLDVGGVADELVLAD